MHSLIRKIRTFGLKGCLDQLRALPKKIRIFRILANSKSEQKPTPGVTIIAPLSQRTSLGKVMNDLITALSKTDIPFQTLDTEHPERRTDGFAINRYTQIIGMLGSPAIHEMSGTTYSEVIFWEFEDGVTAAYPHLLDGNKGIIAMSDFNAQCYRNELPPKIPVFKINYPLILSHTADTLSHPLETRKRFNIPAESFAVFFNVGIGSNRKNPEGCIAAFAKAFANTPNAVLVFKISHAKRFPDIYNHLLQTAQKLGIRDRFIVIDDFLSEEDVYALTNCCDCYLSLHRGEGFGLGVAEAMSLGKPVVVTDYSSTTEFCNSENSLPIPYKLIKPVLSDFDRSVYHHVSSWADPDIDAAASALRKLYEDKDFRTALGKSAAASIRMQFSSEAFKTSVVKFLSQSR